MNALVMEPVKSRALIVVANGSPDNRVLLILTHTLDGEKHIDIAFPKHKSVSIFDYIHRYVTLGYEYILIVIDQCSS